jgi:RNA polymerase sigma-70 factor, ECF subfamily
MARPPSEMTDRELVNQSLAGDKTAFQAIYERHASRLRAALKRLDDDVDDLVNETFFTAFKRLSYFRYGADLGPWLHTIASNLFRTELRKKNRQPRLRDEAIEAALELADVRASPEDVLSTRELAALVQNAIDAEFARLTKVQKVAYTHIVVEKLSHDEAAVVSRYSPATLRVEASKARQKLIGAVSKALESSAQSERAAAATFKVGYEEEVPEEAV